MTEKSLLPAWLPLRELGFGVVITSLFSAIAVGLWLGDSFSHNRLQSVENEIRAQRTLEPMMVRLRQQRKAFEKMWSATPSLPRPATVTDMISSLQKIATAAGVRNAAFMPNAATVVASDTIRVNVQCMADSESFRRFLIRLSDQSWVSSSDAITMRAASPMPRFELAVQAAYGTAASKAGGKP